MFKAYSLYPALALHHLLCLELCESLFTGSTSLTLLHTFLLVELALHLLPCLVLIIFAPHRVLVESALHLLLYLVATCCNTLRLFYIILLQHSLFKFKI